jgi:hypothetical protein
MGKGRSGGRSGRSGGGFSHTSSISVGVDYTYSTLSLRQILREGENLFLRLNRIFGIVVTVEDFRSWTTAQKLEYYKKIVGL